MAQQDIVCKAMRSEDDCVEEDLRFKIKISEPCDFGTDAFLSVMDNLMRNPNLTSSNLFRADILWDSEKDAGFDRAGTLRSPKSSSSKRDYVHTGQQGLSEGLSPFIKYMKVNLRPRSLHIEGYQLKRCLVRELVPRNENRDKRLAQTVSFWRRKVPAPEPSVDEPTRRFSPDQNPAKDVLESTTSKEIEESLVVCLPHVSSPDSIPHYHPKVRGILFSFTMNSNIEKKLCVAQSSSRDPKTSSTGDASGLGIISIHVCYFECSLRPMTEETTAGVEATDRLQKTVNNLSHIICKHGHSTQQGYKKRMHHDKVIPQARLQDTYALLKSKYANWLLHDCWKEQTDATKGIFEDLSIAAFLIESWKDMYPGSDLSLPPTESSLHDTSFPGFVDVACGNGVLVCVLACEGYKGFGFDARSRRTWAYYPKEIQLCLVKGVLVPKILQTATNIQHENNTIDDVGIPVHNGIFTEQNPGFPYFPRPPFIISNHTDELTLWTPLIAFTNGCCPFLAIPCCSHDLSGAKTRFTDKLCSVGESDSRESLEVDKTGELKPGQKGQISAYQGLCNALTRLSLEIGYNIKSEWLRIPSTRNFGVIGIDARNEPDYDTRMEGLKCKIEKEMHGKSMEEIRFIFLQRLKTITNTSRGH